MENKNHGFAEAFAQTILDRQKLPKIKIELEIQPILQIFLEELMREIHEDKDIKLIAPEFPIKKEVNAQPINVDYLLRADKEIYLVKLELADNQDREKIYEQLVFYKGFAKKILKEDSAQEYLLSKIGELIEKSKKNKKKYEFLAKTVKKEVPDSKIEKVHIVYIVPTEMKNCNEEKVIMARLRPRENNIELRFHSLADVVSDKELKKCGETEQWKRVIRDLFHKIDDPYYDAFEKRPDFKFEVVKGSERHARRIVSVLAERQLLQKGSEFDFGQVKEIRFTMGRKQPNFNVHYHGGGVKAFYGKNGAERIGSEWSKTELPNRIEITRREQ